MAAESVPRARAWVRHSGWYDMIMGYHTPVISEGRRYTWQGGRVIPGLTSVMTHQLMVERRKRGKRIRLKRTGIRGAQLGSLVHRQIEDWILHDGAGFRARHPRGPHAYTVRAMDEMVRVRGWQPIRAEYVVHDPQVNMATRIDVVCLKRDGTPVFVELKTQYEGGAFDAQDPDKRWRCSGPLRGCSCTPADQAAVQITLGVIMVRLRRRCARAISYPRRCASFASKCGPIPSNCAR